MPYFAIVANNVESGSNISIVSMADEDFNKQGPLSRISAIVAKDSPLKQLFTASTNMCANVGIPNSTNKRTISKLSRWQTKT